MKVTMPRTMLSKSCAMARFAVILMFCNPLLLEHLYFMYELFYFVGVHLVL